MNILKNKDFRNLMIGKATSILGSNMQQFALSLYVLAITGSATIFASMLAISILPRIFLSPVAGVFGDWFDRKKMIVRLDLLNGFLIGGYAIYFYLNNGLSLFSIYVLVIVLEIIEIFFGSAMIAVIPSIVEKERLFDANSVRSVVSSTANIISPMLASALYAFFGLQIMLIVNAISFILSAILEMSIDIPKNNKEPEKIDLHNFKRDFIEGLGILKRYKILLNIIAFGVFLNFSLGPLMSVGIIFVIIDVLGGTEIQYGVVSTIFAASMLISPMVLGKQAKKIEIGRLLIMTFFLISILVLVLAFFSSNGFIQNFATNTIPMVLITSMLFLIGLFVTIVNIALGTMFQTIVPGEFMGRVGSVMELGLIATIPIGQILFGIGIDLFSAGITFAIVGIIVLGATIYFRKPFLKVEKEEPCNLNFFQVKAE
ncbi:MAG: MFS transporter [Bacillota bacterium]|nr:MFS transporter [Bacillota bacterium]